MLNNQSNADIECKPLIQVNSAEFWKATITLSVSSFFIFASLHMVQPLLPLFSKEFGVSPTTASLAVSLVTLTLSISLVIFGILSDTFGRKNIMSMGLMISSLLSITVFFVPNFTVLLVLRALQGLFLASLPAVALAYIGEEYDKSAIGLAIGLYISGNSLGGMGGRIVSGFIADLWGWQYSFLFVGGLGIISFFLFIFYLPSCKNFNKQSFSIRTLIHSFDHYKNPILRKAFYIGGVLFFIFIGSFNYLGYHLHQEPFNLSTTVIGLIYITYLSGTFSSTLSGRLDHRLNSSERIMLGFAIILLGLILMIISNLMVIFIGLLIFVFGFFFAHSAASSWVSHYALTSKASASGLYLFTYYVGGSIGSTSLGFIYEPYGWTGLSIVTILMVLIGLGIGLKMYFFEKKLHSEI